MLVIVFLLVELLLLLAVLILETDSCLWCLRWRDYYQRVWRQRFGSKECLVGRFPGNHIPGNPELLEEEEATGAVNKWMCRGSPFRAKFSEGLDSLNTYAPQQMELSSLGWRRLQSFTRQSCFSLSKSTKDFCRGNLLQKSNAPPPLWYTFLPLLPSPLSFPLPNCQRPHGDRRRWKINK